MIKITKIQEYEFEMPDSCYYCPVLKSDHDMNCCINSCELKKDPDWTKETVNANYDKRDPKCPLEDGKSYTIYTHNRDEKQISVE